MKNLLIRAASVCLGMCVFLSGINASANPLFESDSVLKIEIRGPIDDLARKAPTSTDPYPATLVVHGETPEEYAIELSARGNSRRDKKVCSFPPLRVVFPDKPGEGFLFEDQKRLKLVTHCKKSSSYQDYYLLEYTAYKFLNALTDQSLRVRLAEIDYYDTEDEKITVTRYGFFIEDTDDAAKRLGVKEIDIADIDVTQLNSESAARYALFQYLIGNLDWSMHNGPPGEDCCHNTKLIGDRETLTNLVPVPYDFDYSGFVDAPYAIPADSVGVRRVTTRRYRGFCAHNDALAAQIPAFIAEKQTLHDILAATPEMRDRTRNKAKRFLDSFFHAVRDQDSIEKQLIKYCR